MIEDVLEKYTIKKITKNTNLTHLVKVADDVLGSNVRWFGVNAPEGYSGEQYGVSSSNQLCSMFKGNMVVFYRFDGSGDTLLAVDEITAIRHLPVSVCKEKPHLKVTIGDDIQIENAAVPKTAGVLSFVLSHLEVTEV